MTPALSQSEKIFREQNVPYRIKWRDLATDEVGTLPSLLDRDTAIDIASVLTGKSKNIIYWAEPAPETSTS